MQNGKDTSVNPILSDNIRGELILIMQISSTCAVIPALVGKIGGDTRGDRKWQAIFVR
jgi:hypothetical protein